MRPTFLCGQADVVKSEPIIKLMASMTSSTVLPDDLRALGK